MISFQETNQTSSTTQEENSQTTSTESLYSKYEPIIVSMGIILVMAIIFILIKDALRGFLTKRRGKAK